MRNTGLSYLILYYHIQVFIAIPLSVTFNASCTVDKLHTLQLHYVAQQLSDGLFLLLPVLLTLAQCVR